MLTPQSAKADFALLWAVALTTGVLADSSYWCDMREPYLELYVHLVWATWDRRAVLTPDLLSRAFACMQRDCTAMNAQIVAAGGTEDHVHLLVRIPSTLTVAALVKQLKGSSSHLLNHECGLRDFKWQGA